MKNKYNAKGNKINFCAITFLSMSFVGMNLSYVHKAHSTNAFWFDNSVLGTQDKLKHQLALQNYNDDDITKIFNVMQAKNFTAKQAIEELRNTKTALGKPMFIVKNERLDDLCSYKFPEFVDGATYELLYHDGQYKMDVATLKNYTELLKKELINIGYGYDDVDRIFAEMKKQNSGPNQATQTLEASDAQDSSRSASQKFHAKSVKVTQYDSFRFPYDKIRIS